MKTIFVVGNTGSGKTNLTQSLEYNLKLKELGDIHYVYSEATAGYIKSLSGSVILDVYFGKRIKNMLKACKENQNIHHLYICCETFDIAMQCRDFLNDHS